jgi:DNA-binding IclR family transcriptional regulator
VTAPNVAVPPLPHADGTTSDPPAIRQTPTEAYYVSRTLQALELLTFDDLSCPQVATALQIHPRTARRLLVRLAADGYIEQTFDSRRRYRATLRLAALGCQVIAHAELPRIAAPHVAELHATTCAVAHLMIPSYRGVACVVHCDDTFARRPDPMLRELLPAHATAAGKVLLAFRQPWRDSVLARPLRRYTGGTITSARDIERAAAEIRERGYAVDEGEYRSETLGIAAPIFVRGDVPAALALSSLQRDGVHVVDALIERVVTAAVALTLALKRPEPGSDGRRA